MRDEPEKPYMLVRLQSTIQIRTTPGRGATTISARANKLIQDALEGDGFRILNRPGYAVPLACSTDVFDMNYVDPEEEDDG